MKKSLIALCLLAATSAFAGGGAGTLNNVTIADNGIGDVLIAPVFFSNGGWSSELKLVNNSTIYSTAVKVVFHRRSDSREVLDFFVYLSPGDTWTGLATQNPTTGLLQVNTAGDDSTPQAPNGVFSASGAADIGYIVVHENAAWNLGPAPVSKALIVGRFNDDAAKSAIYSENANRAIGQVGTENIISGNLRMLNAANNAAAALPLVAIANYNNRTPLTLGGLTLLGNDQVGNASSSYTDTASVEAQLWGNNYAYTFDAAQGQTLGSVTFPTRNTFDNSNAHGVTFGTYPFRNVQQTPVPASFAVRDMSETILVNAQQVAVPVTSPLPPATPAALPPTFAELGFFQIATAGSNVNDQTGTINTVSTVNQAANTPITRGWVSLVLNGVNGSYANAVSGAPAIATQMNTSIIGNGLRLEWFYPPFKSTTGAGSRGND
jgi:hypothetical protein